MEKSLARSGRSGAGIPNFAPLFLPRTSYAGGRPIHHRPLLRRRWRFEDLGRKSTEMGAANTSISGSDYETHVILHVYDLTPINNYMYWFGCGIFHSGIEGMSVLIPSFLFCPFAVLDSSLSI